MILHSFMSQKSIKYFKKKRKIAKKIIVLKKTIRTKHIEHLVHKVHYWS